MTSDMHTSLLELEGFDLSAPPTNHLHLPLHLHGKDGLNYVVILEIIIIIKKKYTQSISAFRSSLLLIVFFLFFFFFFFLFIYLFILSSQ
jgi:hypothetical protein